MKEEKINKVELINVYDNNVYDHTLELKSSWGFACVVKGFGRTILFDTGEFSDILLHNMKIMGIDPLDIDIVVLSHADKDHSGGLQGFLEVNPRVDLYLLDNYSHEVYAKAKELGARVHIVEDFFEIIPSVYSTGDMPTNRTGDLHIGKKEQSLILSTTQGLIVITGCAHADIISITKKIKIMLDEKIILITGGFHYLDSSEKEISEILANDNIKNIPYIAPTHCSGELIVSMLKKEKKNNPEFGLGKILNLEALFY